jgi:hypothetical protein
MDVMNDDDYSDAFLAIDVATAYFSWRWQTITRLRPTHERLLADSSPLYIYLMRQHDERSG